MDIRIRGLDPAPFQPLFAADPATLAADLAVIRTVESSPGSPCRVTLEDAAPGETVALLGTADLSADTAPLLAQTWTAIEIGGLAVAPDESSTSRSALITPSPASSTPTAHPLSTTSFSTWASVRMVRFGRLRAGLR